MKGVALGGYPSASNECAACEKHKLIRNKNQMNSVKIEDELRKQVVFFLLKVVGWYDGMAHIDCMYYCNTHIYIPADRDVRRP